QLQQLTFSNSVQNADNFSFLKLKVVLRYGGGRGKTCHLRRIKASITKTSIGRVVGKPPRLKS
ncbi:unnamed protein product, partial [Choristocarpus tenellus]